MSEGQKRRWFQFGLGELLVLTALLAVVWWQCSTWLVTVRVPKFVTPWPSGIEGFPVGLDHFTKAATRPPTALEALARGLAWSSGVVVLWIGGRVALRLTLRSKAPRTRWLRSAIVAGTVSLGLWLAFLSWAFISYPAMDNLAVGLIVYALLGLPGLESMAESIPIFSLVLFGETLAIFLAFAGLGAVIGLLQRPAQGPTHS